MNDSESFGFYATYAYVEFVPISGVPKSGCDRSSEIFWSWVAGDSTQSVYSSILSYSLASTCPKSKNRSEKALVFGLALGWFIS